MEERRGREVRIENTVYVFDHIDSAQAFLADPALHPDPSAAHAIHPTALPAGCTGIQEGFTSEIVGKRLAREKAIRDVEVQKMRAKARAKDRRINGPR